jgi:hypothetical protein
MRTMPLSRRRLLRSTLIITAFLSSTNGNVERSYNNITLWNDAADLSVVVYLPFGVSADHRKGVEINDLFYYSSRFDHGSMIGSITRWRQPKSVDTPNHVLFGTNLWRIPHNVRWPESGVGLASEFGVGDNGAFCYYRCGWYQQSDITNGVLGYEQAKVGESFLKIGVGELKKGTCPACDSTEEYMVCIGSPLRNSMIAKLF